MTVKVLYKNPICSFNTEWLKDIVNEYLEFQPWDQSRTYDKGTLFYLNCTEFLDSSGQDFCTDLLNRGFRVVIDNLWEVNPGTVPYTHRIVCDQWFWFNESLWYQYLGYDQYRPQIDYQYRALMPMNRRRPHRDDFLTAVDTKDLLWSYVATGRQLPQDGDMSQWQVQRYMNPTWYDQSYASMVVETVVRPGSKYTPVFITEKTMKPLAFQHPFLVYGNRGLLQTLHSWGFETWDNLWDESYDQLVSHTDRRDAVARLLNQIQPVSHSQQTQARLTHNHERFFNRELVIKGIQQQILQPMVEYA